MLSEELRLSEKYLLLDDLLFKISKSETEYPEPKLCRLYQNHVLMLF